MRMSSSLLVMYVSARGHLSQFSGNGGVDISTHPRCDGRAESVDSVNGSSSSRWTVNWAGQRLHRQMAIRSSIVATRTSGD